MLMQVMDSQLTVLENYLATFGIDLFGPGGRHDLSQFIADPGRLFGHVQYAVSGAYVFGITHDRHRLPRPVLRRPAGSLSRGRADLRAAQAPGRACAR